MRTRIIVPKKILGLKALEHFRDRMALRKISEKDVIEVLTKREHVKRENWKDRHIISARTSRGFVSIITDQKERKLHTCWVV